MATLRLSLISHTNVGKTTLARTLLRQDVGEVIDQAHVTEASEAHLLIATESHRLELWDTPGLGDTARLMRRLRQQANPLGWFLHQVWDRVLHRPLWCSQQAVRHIKRDSDVVLYLVNAAEEPEDAGYVSLELELLTWIGRPVLILLNHVGPHGPDPEPQWRRLAERWPIVGGVLSLDAFTRCWIQEGVLLVRVGGLLEGEQRRTMQELAEAWNRRNLATFRQCCEQMARYVADVACDREAAGARSNAAAGPPNTLRALKDALRVATVDKKRAVRALNERLDIATRQLMERLIAAHGLSGTSASTIERHWREFQVRGAGLPLDERSGALAGAVISGALSGLAADALGGGLSLGGGMIAGGILGALGGAAVGRAYRLVGGQQQPFVRWSPQFLDVLLRQALLRYLAVAHFGRGRGQYRDLEQPAHWTQRVDDAVAPQNATLQTVWDRAEQPDGHSAAAEALTRTMRHTLETVLRRAYPEGAKLLDRS